METLKAKKMPGGFGSKPSGFGKKKLNLKKITGASKGALAAVEIHNTFYKAEEQRNKKKTKVIYKRVLTTKQLADRGFKFVQILCPLLSSKLK